MATDRRQIPRVIGLGAFDASTARLLGFNDNQFTTDVNNRVTHIRINGELRALAGGGSGTDSRLAMEIIRSAIFNSNTSKTSTFTSAGFPETDTFTLANSQEIVASYSFNTAGFPTRVRYAGGFISAITGTAGQVLDHNFAFNTAGFPTTDTWTFDSTAILMFSLALEPNNGFITYNFDDSIEDTITVNNGIVTVPDSSFTINNGVVDYTGN